MNIERAIQITKEYNQWRTWDDDDDTIRPEMPKPRLITEALNALVAFADKRVNKKEAAQ